MKDIQVLFIHQHGCHGDDIIQKSPMQCTQSKGRDGGLKYVLKIQKILEVRNDIIDKIFYIQIYSFNLLFSVEDIPTVAHFKQVDATIGILKSKGWFSPATQA